MKIIKRIFIYWHSGFINAPEIVRRCLLSWKIMNRTYEIIELDDTNLSQYINIKEHVPDIDKKNITKTALSDIIRMLLLHNYGGFWCDATLFCNVPLDNWIEKYIEHGFFAFNKPGPDRMLSNWFLYGTPDNIIIEKWLSKIIDYWKNNDKVKTYFFVHYLFADLYNEYPKCRDMWDKINKISADGPHHLQFKGLMNKIDDNTKQHIDNRKSHLYKLTYKIDFGKFNNNCVLKYLYDTNTIKLIHIGKCGGTTVKELFQLQEYHCQKPAFNPNEYYIIWLRNPIHRFVSAYNMSHHLINLDISKFNINNITLDNCIAPARVRNKIINKNKITFDKEYDDLINFFGTPNNLAESITSNNNHTREKALKLMNYESEHINKGIGWYLNNGEFIEKHHKNIIFVGKIETMENDLNALSKLLKTDIANKNHHIRENKNKNTYLSDLAIKNIKEYYKDTDYRTLRILQKYSFIDEKTLQEYHTYKTQN